MGFKYDINHFLAARASSVPLKDLAAIIQSRGFHPSIQRRLEEAEKNSENGPGSPACVAETNYREQFRTAVLKTMDGLHLDAFVYPTWSNVPRLIGDLNTPAGDNSQVFSPTTGFPAINVPMGYTRGALCPRELLSTGVPGRKRHSSSTLYAYEQATRHRHAPPSTPPLR